MTRHATTLFVLAFAVLFGLAAHIAFADCPPGCGERLETVSTSTSTTGTPSPCGTGPLCNYIEYTNYTWSCVGAPGTCTNCVSATVTIQIKRVYTCHPPNDCQTTETITNGPGFSHANC